VLVGVDYSVVDGQDNKICPYIFAWYKGQRVDDETAPAGSDTLTVLQTEVTIDKYSDS